MRLKLKIRLGFIILFFIIIAIDFVSLIFFNESKKASDNIMKDNFYSIEVGNESIENLSMVLLFQIKIMQNKNNEYIKSYNININNFYENLEKLEGNITEIGEADLLKNIRLSFTDYIKLFNQNINNIELNYLYNTLITNYVDILNNCNYLIKINSEAMKYKNEIAKNIFNQVNIYIIAITSISIILTVILIIYLPRIIVNPILKFIKYTENISNKNYTENVLQIKTNDEIGILAKSFNQMSLKLKDYEESNISIILSQKSQIEAIVKNLQDGIIAINSDKKIILANPIAVNLIGIEEKDLINKYITEISVYNNLVRELIKYFYPKEENNKKDDVLIISIDSEEKFFKKKYYDIINNKNENIGNIIVLEDVSEYKKLDMAKTNFIATISHELRTPIATINMSLNLLQSEKTGQLNEEQRQLLSTTKQEVSRLSSIVKETIEISQLETGKIKLTFQLTNPKDIIMFAKDVFNFQAQQRKIEIITDIEEDLPFINVDVEKIIWVLTNLIGNALRYTSDNGFIQIGTKKVDENYVEFFVEDRGKGIDKKYQDKIFNKFFKIPNSSSEGFGLGLVIAKEFIESHNGKIWVESEVGKGSTFVFIIPNKFSRETML